MAIGARVIGPAPPAETDSIVPESMLCHILHWPGVRVIEKRPRLLICDMACSA